MCKGTSSIASICRSDSLAVPSYLDPRSPAWLNDSNPDPAHSLSNPCILASTTKISCRVPGLHRSVSWLDSTSSMDLEYWNMQRRLYIRKHDQQTRLELCMVALSGFWLTIDAPKEIHTWLKIELRSSCRSGVATRATSSCCVNTNP